MTFKIKIIAAHVSLLLICLIVQPVATTNLSENSPCELKTRGHLSRCDKYFQCVVLPSKKIIWVSKQCGEGLIYEKYKGQCVVPDLNWECELVYNSEERSTEGQQVNDQENIYGVNNFADYLTQSEESSGAGEEVTDGPSDSATVIHLQESTPFMINNQSPNEEFSGDGIETTTLITADTSSSGSSAEDMEDVILSSTEAVSVDMPITLDRDGTVTSYLQRLTQLIDGFRKNGGLANDITPDQLNAFVVMQKIKSNKNFDPTGTLLPQTGEIKKPHMDYILEKQQSLNSFYEQKKHSTASPVRRRIIHIIRPFDRPKHEDSTNIKIDSQLGGGNGNASEFGSNSQIVVNRPEGSVLFNMAAPSQPPVTHSTETPISQDTLKSVMELSKQLVSHQKYLAQKSQYLAPVLQPVPVYYTVPMTVQVQSSGSVGSYTGPSLFNETFLHSTKPDQNSATESQSFLYRFSTSNNNDGNYGGITKPNQAYIHPVNKYYSGSYGSYYKPFRSTFNGQNNYNYDPNYTKQQKNQYYNPSVQFGNNQGQANNEYDQSMNDQEFYDSRPGVHYFGDYPTRPPSLVYASDEENVDDEELGSEDYEYGASEERPIDSKHESSVKPTTLNTPFSNLQLLSQQLLLDDAGNKNKVVGINGNYMSVEAYKGTILPLLNGNQNYVSPSNLEIVSCSAGVRHSNSSDCTRYYVCNPNSGDLLGYICPPFTAFNANSRICDANAYARCKPRIIGTKFTIEENKRLQYEAQKALQEAKKIRDQALQAQNFVQYLHQQGSPISAVTKGPTALNAEKPSKHKLGNRIRNHIKKRPGSNSHIASGHHIHRPSSSLFGKGKKRYKCTDAGQAIPDEKFSHQYFVCFRDQSGKLKRRSLTCSKGLVFCSSRRICTFKSRCS